MNSIERHEARYQRRKARREAKKIERYSDCLDFEKVFSFEHLYRSYEKARCGVAWKASVQKYIAQAPIRVKKTQQQLMDGRFRSPGFHEFDLYERGKKRHIRSVGINERVVQRCLCDYSLYPVLGRSFIYDDGACQKGRGYHFAVRRMERHLQHHYRKHGTDGYVLLFDFTRFFENVSHVMIKRTIRKEYSDERIIALLEHFIDMFGDHGLGLGSQISQTLALSSANKLDHFIKETMRIKGYGRYMDDGYLIHESKEFLKECLVHLKRLCRELKITLNEKKTQIVKLSHGFTWLKIRFFITDKGKIIKKIYKKSVTRMRRKLKKFRKFVDEGRMTYDDAYNSYAAWKAYAIHFDAWHTLRRMDELYDELFMYGGNNVLQGYI